MILTPFSLSLSAHTKTSALSSNNERISPPSSDFDFEGVTIIDLALDKYSQQKATKDSFTDSEIISNEVLLNTPERRARGLGSFSSLGTGSTHSLTDPELPVGSYGAMLRSYAGRNSKPQNIPASSARGDVGGLEAGSTPVLGSTPEQGGSVGKEGGRNNSSFDLAMSLQYEVCVCYCTMCVNNCASMCFGDGCSIVCSLCYSDYIERWNVCECGND